MSMAEATTTPARLHLVDLSTGEDLEVLFNPEQLQEELAVAYAKPTVPGLSHRPMHYTNTENQTVAIDLYAVGNTEDERAAVDNFRRFLMSLCFPKGNAGTIDDGAPPRVLFVWPRVWSFTVGITNLRFAHSQFALDGAISRFMATLTLEEIRDGRLTSEDVRRNGTRRSAAGGGAPA